MPRGEAPRLYSEGKADRWMASEASTGKAPRLASRGVAPGLESEEKAPRVGERFKPAERTNRLISLKICECV